MKNDAAAGVKRCLNVMERSKLIERLNYYDDDDDDGDDDYDNDDSVDGVGSGVSLIFKMFREWWWCDNNWVKANLFELAEDERELTEFAESRP